MALRSKASKRDTPINAALRQFEATEANVAKLERLWVKILKTMPTGLAFGSDEDYEELVRTYQDILDALPNIDGWRPEHVPMDFNAIGQCRLDAEEIGEIEAKVAVEEQIESPGRDLAKYRHRLNKKRRQLIRSALGDLVASIDVTVSTLAKGMPKRPTPQSKVRSPGWAELKDHISQVDSLLGDSVRRPSRWSDLQRHLGFGMMQDLTDIINLDWPEVKSGLELCVYDANDPIPVEVSDLDLLASAQPKGLVVTKLKWDTLSAEDFERFIFSLIAGTAGYQDPQWLMQTNAPDRGRDLSVFRITEDLLSGVTRSRVIIQCRHRARSVAPADVGDLKEQIALWEPPRIDVLVIATTGRFTSDAVSAIEKHNASDRALKIEMWPESHLEKLLAKRPSLIAEFQLR